MSDELNPYAAPTAASFPVYDTTPTLGPWRENKLLVMLKKGAMPDRCIKCNQPTDPWRLKRKLSWHHPAWFLVLLFCNVLVYVIVALIVRETAQIHIALCQIHRSKRRQAIVVGWVGTLAGVGMMVLGFNANDQEWSILAGMLVIVASAFYGLLGSQMIAVKRIDSQHVWLKRVHPDYLAELAEFSTRAEAVASDYTAAIDRQGTPSQKPTALYNRALTYAFEKNYALAITDLEAVLALPQTPPALRTKAEERLMQIRKSL